MDEFTTSSAMRVLETNTDTDLSLFSRFLWQQGVVHRIFEEQGRQILELQEAANAETVQRAFADWQSGDLTLEAKQQPKRINQPWFQWPRQFPVLTAIIVVCLVVFPFSYYFAQGEPSQVMSLLLILSFDQNGQFTRSLPELLAQGQWWRLITPMFIHFSVVHLVFNLAVFVQLGKRIESQTSYLLFLLMILGISMVSNLVQLGWGGSPSFGGMSGVVFGLLGFVLVAGWREKDNTAWQLPKGFGLSLLFFLVLFSTGVTQAFNLYVANAAHWSGLVSGALLALVVFAFRKKTST